MLRKHRHGGGPPRTRDAGESSGNCQRFSLVKLLSFGTDERDFMLERQRLRESIDRFASGGSGICTKHPHFFFGPLTPVEWAVLMYQHLDHHLRQFGV